MSAIALIEDDFPTADLFRRWLKTSWPEHDVEHFSDRTQAEQALGRTRYVLVILDIELGTDKLAGVGLINKINRENLCPVLVISGEPIYRPIMLELDAWDFLQKPVDESSFIAVVRSILRKVAIPSTPVANKSALVIDFKQSNPATWRRQRLNLPITAVRLLSHLYERKNSVVEKKELYEYLPTGRNDANLRSHIQVIRDAFRDIDESFDSLVTIPIKGYMWRE